MIHNLKAILAAVEKVPYVITEIASFIWQKKQPYVSIIDTVTIQ